MASMTVGQFRYSSSSSPLSSSSSSSSLGSQVTPERQRGPAHGEPAAYFLSEGGISPGSHTAIYGLQRRHHPAQPHASSTAVEQDAAMEWSPSSSASTGTSPRACGASGNDRKTSAVAVDASVASLAKSRSPSPQQAPSSSWRLSGRTSGSGPTQFTLPTLSPLRDKSESVTWAGTSHGATDVRPKAMRDGDTLDMRHHRRRDTEDTTENTKHPSPQPSTGSRARPGGHPIADASSSTRSETNGGTRRESPRSTTASPPQPPEAVTPSSTALGAGSPPPRDRRLGSPGRAVTHSPHKRRLPPQALATITNATAEPWNDEGRTHVSPSNSQPRRSASAQPSLQYNYADADDDDAGCDRPPALSPPPKLQRDDAVRSAGDENQLGDVTEDVLSEAERFAVAAAGPSEVRKRLTTAAAPQPELKPTATLASLSAYGGGDDGVVQSPVSSARQQQLSHRSPSHPLGRETVSVSASAHTISTSPPAASPSRSPSAVRGTPTTSCVAASQSHLTTAKRRLRLHTVSSERGPTLSEARAQHRSTAASSILSGLSSVSATADADDTETEPVTPLLLTILRGGGSVPAGAAATECSPPVVEKRPSPAPIPQLAAPSRATLRAVPFASARTASPNTVPIEGERNFHTRVASASRSSLFPKADAFRSRAIRARGTAACAPVFPPPDEVNGAVAKNDAEHDAGMPNGAESSFHLQFIPYVATRPSPVQARAAVDAATQPPPQRRTEDEHVIMMKRARGGRAVAVNDSATSPITVSQVVPSSLWSSYHQHDGKPFHGGVGLSSPRPQDPRRASLQGTPTPSPVSAPSLASGRRAQQSPRLVSAAMQPIARTPKTDSGETILESHVQAEREPCAVVIEQNRLVTRLLAQKKQLHAEACDREKLTLLEGHFRRCLQTEWFYHLAADRLLQGQPAAAPSCTPERSSPRASPPRTLFDAFGRRSKHCAGSTATVARIMAEQTALAEELQYLSSALADLMEQHT